MGQSRRPRAPKGLLWQRRYWMVHRGGRTGTVAGEDAPDTDSDVRRLWFRIDVALLAVAVLAAITLLVSVLT